MTSIEATSETFTQLTPNCGYRFVYLSATPVNDADFITVDELTTIKGYYLQMDDGSALTTSATFATNVLTLGDGSSVTPVTGFVWGI